METISLGGVFLNRNIRLIAAGGTAGAVNGLFGAGGGMALVPMLQSVVKLPDACIFPASVTIILPICIISASLSFTIGPVDLQLAAPFLIGGAIGGLIAGLTSHKIPVIWLRRVFGLIILWGGIRYLW